jgi:predicted RNA polymerase sigma factor
VLRVLYLLFNEGYATSAGNELARTDLSGEAVRLARILAERLPMEILALYDALERLTGNPMVTLNRAVAAAMVHGPAAGLALLATVAEALGEHHRLHAVGAHLLERAARSSEAFTEFTAAAARTTNLPEQHYLTAQAARVRAGIAGPPHSL